MIMQLYTKFQKTKRSRCRKRHKNRICRYKTVRKKKIIFPIPMKSVHKRWERMGIKIWIILSVLEKNILILHSIPALSSALTKVDLDSGLM